MLSEAPDRTLRMSQLAEQTTSSASRLSHAVARLEEKGWVRRDKHPTDRRGSLAVLTDDGWQAVRAAAPGHVAAVRAGALRPARTGPGGRAAGDHRPAHRPALACAAWLSSSPRRTRPRRPRRRTPARARRTRGRSPCAASRWSTAPPTSGCWTRTARATGCTATRGGCCASRPSSSRASARWPSSARRSASSARPGCTPTSPSTPWASRSAGSWSRRATPSSPAAAPARWRPPTGAPARPAASRSGSASSCPSSRA